MDNPRLKALKIMPLLRPLTQNGLLKATTAKKLVTDYITSGDVNALIEKIECIQAPDMFIPLRGIVIANIKKEMEETK